MLKSEPFFTKLRLKYFESTRAIMFYRLSVAKKRIYFVDNVTFKIMVDVNYLITFTFP